jgi:hypothetical protein
MKPTHGHTHLPTLAKQLAEGKVDRVVSFGSLAQCLRESDRRTAIA